MKPPRRSFVRNLRREIVDTPPEAAPAETALTKLLWCPHCLCYKFHNPTESGLFECPLCGRVREG